MKENTEQKNIVSKKQVFNGVVVSDKMKDTVVVVVERYVKDKRYHKFITMRKRFKVHNPGNTKKVGDKVMIESCRPISKEKSFQILEK